MEEVKFHLVLLVVLCLLNLVALETDFKQLGSHSPPSHGATILAGKFPPPGVLFYHFIQPGKPLLMKNVLGETGYPAFLKWTDDYLSSQYGQEIVDIEKGKKENRDGGSIELTLSNFIKVYKNSNLYMVHTIPETMLDEVLVPYSLSCGGFQDNLQEAVMWFSGGDTKSVLHYDLVDNINCLLDGKKQLVLIDKEHSPLIEENGWVDEGAYSQVDVDNIDPDKYPGILKAQWYQINMEKGDCVYIPYKWYHHVYSPPGRNVAVNLWFSHLWWFNQTDCKTVNKDSIPMSQFTVASPNEQLRSEFLSAFADMKEISQERFIQDCGCDDEKDAIKMWDLLNWKKDNRLTWDEFYSFKMEEIVQRFPECFHDTPNEEEADEFMKDNAGDSDIVEEGDRFEFVRETTEAISDNQSDEKDFTRSDDIEVEPTDFENSNAISKEDELLAEIASVKFNDFKINSDDTVNDVLLDEENEDYAKDKKNPQDSKHEEL